MRSNRPSYTVIPAGKSTAFEKKPKPKRPKKEINQILLIIFFIVLPILGLLAIFLQPIRFLFIGAVILAIIAMWLLSAFLFPGRMILSAVYGFLMVLTLVSALNGQQRNTAMIQQTTLMTPVPEVTTTPAFQSSYSTMGTNVPADYYMTVEESGIEDELANTVTDLVTGTDDLSDASETDPDSGTAAPYVATVKSAAEIALENFMEKWYKGIVADMVEYTAPSWRNQQEGEAVSQKLFWKFGIKKLDDWRQMTAPTGTDASNARTITIQADVEYNNEVNTYQYDAIILKEDEKWYVDPDSLSSGQLVVQATATPDPNITPTPTPEPTPTPTPGPKTKLYYNKDGGKKYHLDQNCSSVSSKYLPLSGSFNYGDIGKSPYNKLSPCEKCGAPPKK